MSETYEPLMELEGEPAVNRKDFDIETVEDEIRVDGLCRKLLKRFYFSLLEGGMHPHEATALANGADYYVRDFLVGFKHRNLLDERPGIVRQFAGNWYIINNIEPSLEELSGHLRGVLSFYRFLHDRQLIGSDFLASVEKECVDYPFYEERIRSFWEITGDGYLEWERRCSLKKD